jgi:Uma2 family endonuclease
MLKQAKPIRSAAAVGGDGALRISYAEFLKSNWPNPHVEWVDGKVVEMSPITVTHDDLTGFLLCILQIWIEAHDLGQLKHDPFQMKTGPKLPGRAPDIMFVSHRSASRLKKTYLDGPADLVIEVISAGSRSIDRGDKYFEYEQGGVKEYWLLDPIRKLAEFYAPGRDRVYRNLPIGDDGVFRSRVLRGLWLKVDWLWRKPLPSVMSVQKAWKLI